MLKDAGAAYVIVGHSERRTDHGETDAVVKAKTEAAWRAGLVAIVCVGETKDERVAGKALAVVGGQLKGSLPEGTLLTGPAVLTEERRRFAEDELAKLKGILAKDKGEASE